jgi:hypothetical protein
MAWHGVSPNGSDCKASRPSFNAKRERKQKMEMLKLKIKGTSPMLMHSDRFANPLDPATKLHKTMTSKLKKTDEDHQAIARSEFIGSLYIDKDGPYIPGMNIDSCLVEAAKMNKMGKHAKRAMIVMEDKVPLRYDGPRTAEGLADDARFIDARSVRVSGARIRRYRPRFNEWALECTLVVDTKILNINQVEQIVENAGKLIGMGDFRPRFGRFSVEIARA